MAQNLVKRGAVYYVRAAAPKQLKLLRRQVGTTGQNDVWVSLGTKDHESAKRAAPAALLRIYRDFDAETAALLGQGARDVTWTRPVAPDFEAAAWSFIREELRLDEEGRTAWPSPAEIEQKAEATRQSLLKNPPASDLEAWIRPGGLVDLSAFADRGEMDRERRQALAAELQEHLASQTYVLVDWAVWDLARRNHWEIAKDSVEYKTLARHLLRAWIQALKTTFQRDQGIYEEPATVTALPAAVSKPLSAPASDKPKKGESLRDYLDAYLREQKQHLRANARKDVLATVRQFLECNGDRVVTSYTRGDAANFKRVLTEAPARAEKLYPGLPLPKAVERNRKDGHPRLKSNSTRNKLSTLAAFGAWLEANVPGIDAQNFTTTLPPKTDAERMEPFSDEEIRKILNAHAYIGCQSKRDQQKPGEVKIRDWRYWLPLVAAFTGARLNEITQLTVADLDEVDGFWVFRITNEGTGQSLKTKSSRRIVPVHPKLLDLGLIEFRQAAVEKGSAHLFHEIPVDRDGRRSHHAGKWFRKFLKRIGVQGLGGAHRWRHTLTDALRRAGVDDYQIAPVLGHKIDAAKMTAHYGRELAMTLKQRHDLLARAAYPSVDFEALA